MTARYSERAEDALYAFLGDGTTGIAARCAAINADMSETDYPLPTSWQSYQRPGSRRLNPPLYVVYSLRPAYEEGDRRERQGIWIVDCAVELVVGVPSHRSDPTAMQTIRNRVARAFVECLVEEDLWSGHTLGDADGILDAKIQGMPQYIDVEMSGGGKTKRAAVVKYPVRVRIVEDRSATA